MSMPRPRIRPNLAAASHSQLSSTMHREALTDEELPTVRTIDAVIAWTRANIRVLATVIAGTMVVSMGIVMAAGTDHEPTPQLTSPSIGSSADPEKPRHFAASWSSKVFRHGAYRRSASWYHYVRLESWIETCTGRKHAPIRSETLGSSTCRKRRKSFPWPENGPWEERYACENATVDSRRVDQRFGIPPKPREPPYVGAKIDATTLIETHTLAFQQFTLTLGPYEVTTM